MLVLTRAVNQYVVISDPTSTHTKPIVIKISAIDRNQVSLAISAQRQTAIHRGEIYNNILSNHGLGECDYIQEYLLNEKINDKELLYSQKDINKIITNHNKKKIKIKTKNNRGINGNVK